MSRAFVYFILAVLLIGEYCTTAFPSNIHEKMTKAERFAIFGSEDSVPEYEVFSVSLPGARRKRETAEERDGAWNLYVKLDYRNVNLTLKPTAGYLATKYTPVWLAKTDKDAYHNIRYDPLTRAMSSIGDFKMYHDLENEAAMTTYTNRREGIIIEGIVGLKYAIRSLPRCLVRESLEEGSHIIRKQYRSKRSVTVDAEEDVGHVVVFKVQTPRNHVKTQALVNANNLEREKRAGKRNNRRRLPKSLYPEILVVLDYNAIRNHTITRSLRFTLAFWNGVDLLFSALDKPKVRLNIAGIIIAADSWATPYIASNVSVDTKLSANLKQMGEHFYKENIRFPMNWYDLIIAMTTIEMCGITTMNSCTSSLANAELGTACLSKHEISRLKTIKSVGVVGYNWEFTGIIAALEALQFMFGANLILKKKNAECPIFDGHVMPDTYEMHIEEQFSFNPSGCTRRFLSRFFSSKNSTCLDNKPRWTKTVGKVLPGWWMSMDGQCRNKGFAKACKHNKQAMCMTLGCQGRNSPKCIYTRRAALPGSTCATNKHCSTQKNAFTIDKTQRLFVKMFLGLRQ